MFTAKSFTLVCLLAISGIIFCSEPDLTESETESESETVSFGHKRQLSALVKKTHRRIVSLIRPPTFPAVFDLNRARTPSEFNRRRSQIKKDSELSARQLQTNKYSPTQDELDRALILASHYESGSVIALLLEWGARVSAQDEEKRTAAMLACTYGNYRALKALIDGGIDLTKVDCHKKTALIYTCSGQRLLEPEKWGSLHLHETEQVLDPRTRCRELIEAHLKKTEATQADQVFGQNSSVSSKCSCLIL